MNFYDEQEIKKTISVMKPDGQLFEVRVIYGSAPALSGYFTDADTLIDNLRRINHRDCNVYITLNQINKACYSRTQRNEFYKSPKTSTKDNEIDGYDWLMIDLDPDRVTGVSSSEEELAAAHALGNKIYLALKNLGFEKPICADSGNGVHLLYKISLNNNADMTALVKRCLQALDMLFSDSTIKIDVSNHNPSRICKLYGTLAQKGSDTQERPHRMSRITMIPDTIKVTDISYLEKLAKMYPDEPEKPQVYNHYSPNTFDLEAWLNKYGIGYRADTRDDKAVKYVLDHCPFDENHNGKDAVIFKSPNGAIGFHCFHNSCQGKTWKDVRLLFEPNAYERREAERTERMYHSYNRHIKPPLRATQKPTDGSPVFWTAQTILDMKFPEMTFVKTGINVIDKKMRGLGKGQISVWSGLRASGKSSIVSEIGLNARDDGNNVAYFSGELYAKDFMDWMNLQAAGKGYVVETNNDGFYTTPLEVRKKIAEWLEGHFWLYNNDYGNNFREVIERFEKIITENKLDLLILDNLMALDISDLSDSKWDAQKEFVLAIKGLAQRYGIHVAFVAHPRKAMGFLRFDDIAGTADLGNAVDSAFIVHRVNRDFKRYTHEMFGWKDDNEIYEATNVIEIVKDRHSGNQDVFIPLWYEVESKRLKNEKSENIIYGWKEERNTGLTLADFTAVEEPQSEDPFA